MNGYKSMSQYVMNMNNDWNWYKNNDNISRLLLNKKNIKSNSSNHKLKLSASNNCQ